MIEIFLLEQLVAFAKTGTLSQAALELHITQPALSRSMKKLEEELGVPLFDRSKSKIALNETGKVAAKYGERVLEADREMVRQILASAESISARDLEGLHILAHGGAGFWLDICRQNHYLCCLSGEQTRYEKNL